MSTRCGWRRVRHRHHNPCHPTPPHPALARRCRVSHGGGATPHRRGHPLARASLPGMGVRVQCPHADRDHARERRVTDCCDLEAYVSGVAEAWYESFAVALAVEDGLEPAEGLGGVVRTVVAFFGVDGEVVELELWVGRRSGEG